MKDYAREAMNIITVIASRVPHPASLLDVGCGTGLHLSYFAEHFTCVGIDLSSKQLEIARNRLPGIPLIEGDMREFALHERFDVITCLFGAIGYMRNVQDLGRAVGNMEAHLADGGVLILEPWYFTNAWISGLITHETLNHPDLKISRMTTTARHGRHSRMEMVYMVGEPGDITTFREHHTMGLFSVEEYLSAFTAAGLTAEYAPTAGPKGQFIASRSIPTPAP